MKPKVVFLPETGCYWFLTPFFTWSAAKKSIPFWVNGAWSVKAIGPFRENCKKSLREVYTFSFGQRLGTWQERWRWSLATCFFFSILGSFARDREISRIQTKKYLGRRGTYQKQPISSYSFKDQALIFIGWAPFFVDIEEKEWRGSEKTREEDYLPHRARSPRLSQRHRHNNAVHNNNKGKMASPPHR